MFPHWLALLVGLMLLCPVRNFAGPQEGGNCLIHDGDTIVFFGDSITQGGDFIDHFESYLLTRFPTSDAPLQPYQCSVFRF